VNLGKKYGQNLIISCCSVKGNNRKKPEGMN